MQHKKGFVTTILLIAGLYSNALFSQVGGVSSNLLASYNALPVPKNVLELEPTFSYSRSLGFFNSDGNYTNSSGVNIASSLYFRATYGVSDILEIGAGLATTLDVLNLGAKLHLLGNDDFGLALMGGINSDITSGARLLSSLERQFIVGVAGHYLFSKQLSINATIQYQDIRLYQGSDLFINSELGYYINKNTLGIVGFGYSRFSNSESPESKLFSLFPGFALERTNIIIVFQGQFDLFGNNIMSTNGISVSLTQLID